jgi:hypothetical protein
VSAPDLAGLLLLAEHRILLTGIRGRFVLDRTQSVVRAYWSSPWGSRRDIEGRALVTLVEVAQAHGCPAVVVPGLGYVRFDANPGART